MFKKVLGSLALVGGSVGVAAAQSDPVATATTSIGTYSTEITALLLALVMIPIAIYGYRVVKSCLGR
jgi:hypothetical protein